MGGLKQSSLWESRAWVRGGSKGGSGGEDVWKEGSTID